MLLSVIVPARNEANCLAACLKSLVEQSEEGFVLGEHWELIVVDDNSTDQTREIAKSFAGVTVIDPAPLREGWTGKTNACWTAAQQSQGKWLLFTDADTEHRPLSLLHAIFEAERHEVGLLSYSPRQIVQGFWQRAMMPLIFSELAMAYPPKKVNDPTSNVSIANGQFMLFRREAYCAVGGHESVANEVLEDAALANLIKRKRLGLRFRYADDAVSARMYRTTEAMFEGWTKNLALLFGSPLGVASLQLLDLALLVGLPVLMVSFWGVVLARWLFLLLWIRTVLRYYRHRSRSNFAMADCWLSILGLPLFIAVLCRSWYGWRIKKQVTWKGREYGA